MNIVVLISGSGSNLQAIIDAAASGELPGRIAAVISNRPEAFGLERARRAGIAAETLDHRRYPDRETFDQALMALIDRHAPDLVVLAGFMRILTPAFVRHYAGRMLNIHPSLLPRYKGLHTHARALAAGDSEHGVSVHFVTSELDGGPLIAQSVVPVAPGDTVASLSARVHSQEHMLYPMVIEWLTSGRLQWNSGNPVLDGAPLTGPVRFS